MVSTSYTARTKCRWLWREFRREILAAGVGGGERAESHKRWCSFVGVMVVSVRVERGEEATTPSSWVHRGITVLARRQE